MRRWWSRSRGIPAEAYATWREGLATEPGRPPRILAWASSVDGIVVVSPAVLSVLTGTSAEAEWRHVGWHQVERGGWNTETEQLRWQTYAGARGAATLPDPARVPEAFQERVNASIVFERFVQVGPHADRGVVVNGRRDLAEHPSRIGWHATLTRGVTWRTPGVQEAADVAITELRREYDHG